MEAASVHLVFLSTSYIKTLRQAAEKGEGTLFLSEVELRLN